MKNINFINDLEIKKIIRDSEDVNIARAALEKAKEGKGLSPIQALALLENNDEQTNAEVEKLASQLKKKLYGMRVVLFAPIYLSNYCVNGCIYCPYHNKNLVNRRILNKTEIEQETRALLDMGHKRLVIEAGEDPERAPIEYILEAIKIIYGLEHKGASIRRLNINIAATSVENYALLKDANIGTYILFQETYLKEAYKKLHPSGPKSNYEYHLGAMDRAFQGGLEDVGIGALFGLADYKYDLLGTLLHAEHLKREYGIGPHTISVPRIKGVKTDFGITDEKFLKLVAILRLAVPTAGIIISTRESPEIRTRALALGATQISAQSSTSVGGYANNKKSSAQFELSDTRKLQEVARALLEQNYLPSFCTACYASGRKGKKFMALAESGKIGDICRANSLITLTEYLFDYADEETRETGLLAIESALRDGDDALRKALERTRNGERGLSF